MRESGVVASLAYTLTESIRRRALHGTALARAQCGTIRLKLLKIGAALRSIASGRRAVIVRNTRRVRFHLSTACPDKDLFMLAARRLTAG